MLAQQHRLRRRADFARVYKRGKSLQTPLLRISTCANDLSHSRFGVVVPNKVLKSAVDRNRKKRQIRAALTPLVKQVVPGYDVVVSVQAAATTADQAALAADIQAGLAKIRFLVK